MNGFSRWAAAAVLGLALVLPTSRAAAQGFVVVVNAAGPATLSKTDVSRIFLRKSSKLSPVDQGKDAGVRGAFSKAMLGRPLAAVLSYWQQQIFSGGDAPPPEKASDAEVLAYVRSNPNAIGYVSPNADLGSGVRAVTLQ